MKTRVRIFLPVIFAVTILFPLIFSNLSTVEAAGAIYYISTTGNDSTGDGSSGNPWLTFDKGLDTMSSGDTLRAYGGTYNERVIISHDLSGTGGSPTIIESVSGENAIIEYDTSLGQSVVLYAEEFIIRNLEIYGGGTTTTSGQCLMVRPPNSGLEDLSNILLDNLVVHGCSGHGIDIGGRYSAVQRVSEYVTVSNSEIYAAALTNTNELAGKWGSGLKVSRGAENITLSNNVVHDNWGEGIAVTRGSIVDVVDSTSYNNYSVNIYIDNSSYVNVKRNFSYCPDVTDPNAILKSGLTSTGISTAEEFYDEDDDTPLWGNQMTDVNITNNITYNCKRSFAYFGVDNGTGGAINSIVANNTFYAGESTSSMAYIKHEALTSLDVYNNIFVSYPSQNKFVYMGGTDLGGTHNFSNNYWVYDGSATYIQTGTGDQTGNLASVNFAGTAGISPGNFQVNTGSLAINTGTTSPVSITTDYSNTARDVSPDIGAYEYVGAISMTYIDGLAGNTSIKLVNPNTGDGVEVGATGIIQSSSQQIRVAMESGSEVIADVQVDMTSNRTWAGVTGETSIATSKAYAHDLVVQPGASATYTLYVPKTLTQTNVNICPGATSLGTVQAGCAGEYSLSVQDSNVSVVTISGQSYWKVEGLSSTGGFGTGSTNSAFIDLVAQPATDPSSISQAPELAVSTSDEFYLSYIPSTTEFTASDSVDLVIPQIWTGLATCASSTIDADGDSTADGSLSVVDTQIIRFTFTGPTTTALTTGVEFCFAATSSASVGNYNIPFSDTNDGDFGSALIYIGDDNDVTVTASIPVTLSLRVKEPSTTADTNSCLLGVLNPGSVNSCSYRIAAGTNISTGMQVFVLADNQLNTAGDTADIDDVAGGGSVTSGVEEHGVLVNAGTGWIPGASFSESTDEPMPLSETLMFDASAAISDSDTANWSLVTHSASVNTGTAGGSYDQLVTYRAWVDT